MAQRTRGRNDVYTDDGREVSRSRSLLRTNYRFALLAMAGVACSSSASSSEQGAADSGVLSSSNSQQTSSSRESGHSDAAISSSSSSSVASTVSADAGWDASPEDSGSASSQQDSAPSAEDAHTSPRDAGSPTRDSGTTHPSDGGTTPAPPSCGANFYVRPGGAGSKTGADWTNAWGLAAIGWSSVAPGDCVWLAGGSYADTPFAPGASGTEGHPIYIARPLSTDAAPVAAAGWRSSFDAPVVVTNTSAHAPSGCNGGDVLCFKSTTLGNYTVWDGRSDSGITLQTSNIAGLSPTNNTTPGQSALDVPGNGSGGNHDLTFTNIDFAGPCGATECTHLSYDNAILISGVTGNVVITECRIHGGNTNVDISGSSGVTFDHSMFYDNVASDSSAGHGNMMQYAANTDITLRYNEWWNWSVEGLMAWAGPNGPLYVYGNLFRDANNGGYPSVIQTQASGSGPLYFYNNTIANITGYCVFRPDPSTWASGSEARNNLYWNSDVCVQSAPASNYDAYYNDMAASNQSRLGVSETTTVSQDEANACVVPATPFVSSSGGNYELTVNTTAGTNLGAPYNVDKNGKTRTTWTRGAFEF